MFENELLSNAAAKSEEKFYYYNFLSNISSPYSQLIEGSTLEMADLIFLESEIIYSGSEKKSKVVDVSVSFDVIKKDIYYFRGIRRLTHFVNACEDAKELLNDEAYFSLYINLRELICDITYQNLCVHNLVQELLKTSQFKTMLEYRYFDIEEIKNVPLSEDFCLYSAGISVLFNLKDKKTENINLLKVLILCLSDYLENEMPKNQENKVDAATEFNILLDEVNNPVVFLNVNGDISFFNESFTALSLLSNRIIGFQDGDWFEHEKTFFQIKKSEIENIGTIFVFIKSNENAKVVIDLKKELGIITGSIAHELNNPVAGILAAISVLELEEWTGENAKLLNDLKDSASRCKELVETFLGFSRFKGNDQSERGFEGILGQATSLLRFRMIESGLSLSINLEDSISSKKFNTSVFSMVLYLILGELLTVFSHKKLILENLGKILNLSISSDEKSIKIKFLEMELSESEISKFNQKLIHHLLEMDRMNLQVDEKTLYINFCG